jgi:hypothetical protein
MQKRQLTVRHGQQTVTMRRLKMDIKIVKTKKGMDDEQKRILINLLRQKLLSEYSKFRINKHCFYCKKRYVR